jgi:PAS domain S-box-containing protein
MRIVIADDNEDTRYILRKVLESAGHEVHEAENGRDAHQLAVRIGPDLIVSDILMPEMDGFQFCKKIRSDNTFRDTPFIFYTATYTDDKDEQLALELGADRFIRKPMEGEPFLQEIQTVARQASGGDIAAAEPALDDETTFLKLYSERLIRKLEKKIFDLEEETALRRQAENEWRAMFQSIGQMVLVLAPHHGILEANDVALQKTGFSKKEILGKKCYEIIHGLSRPPEGCPMLETLRSSRKTTAPIRINKMEGDYLVTCTPLLNDDGEVEKVLHISTDISAVRKREKDLAESQKRLQLAIDATHLGMWDFNPTTHADTHYNDNWFTMLGYEADELPHTVETWQDLLHPDDRKHADDVLEAHLQEKKPYRLTFRLRGKDGAYHWIHSYGAVVEWDADGKPKRMVGVHLDDTERRQAEEQIRESEKRFATIFSANPAPMAMARIGDGVLVDVNQAWQETTGYTKEQALGRTPFDLNLWVDPEQRKKLLETITMEGKARSEVQLRHRCGDVRDLLFAAERMHLDGSDYMLSMALDISERKQAETQRIEMQDRLNRLQKMESLGNLAGGIAHDFNNILSAILGYTELALDDAGKGTTLEQSLREIFSAGIRARDLVKQILAFARKTDEKRSPLQPRAVVKEVLAFIRSTIPSTIDIQQAIESRAVVIGNATQIHQVLMNLCTNATHAMEDTGGVMRVSLEDAVIGNEDAAMGVRPGSYVKITVSDTGTGIAPDIQSAIFEPYFTTKGPGEGTGMGLAMTQGIVESYGGSIQVESQLGEGTTFTLYLPAVRTQRNTRQTDETASLPTGTERLLLVDDEDPIARMSRQILERLGYAVTIRTSSIEALELFRAKPHDFDLVVSDMTMPNLTGDKLAIELMKIRPDIPVILCTGYSKKISDESASKIGIRAFSYKPVVKADLAKTVRKVLDEAKG